MFNKTFEKISGKWIFVIIVLVLYVVLFFINPLLIKSALSKFFDLLTKIVPILLLVFVFMFVSSIFLESKRIINLLGANAGARGWLISIIGGILSTGPIYAWYPLLSDLKEKEVKDSFITVFLYNRAIKIPLLPMLIYYFGLPFTRILTFYMILFSVINGFLVNKIINN